MDVDPLAIIDDAGTLDPAPDLPVNSGRPICTKRVPLRYIYNTTTESVEGGLLMSVLQGDLELLIEVDHNEFPLFAKAAINVESALANAALTEPIDDPEPKIQNLFMKRSCLYIGQSG